MNNAILDDVKQMKINKLITFCETSANSAKPDQTPQNAASDQLLNFLLTEDFF